MQMVLPGLEFSPLGAEEAPEDRTSPVRGALDVFRAEFRAIRPRTIVPEIEVRFRRSAGASSRVEMRNNRILVKLADVLEEAPGAVMGGLAHILLAKLFRRPVDKARAAAYRLFLNQPEMRGRIELNRRTRGRKEMDGAAGSVYDLAAVFERVNGRYFGGELRVARLGWSKRASRSTLGHYDASHNAIVISKVLDSARVPANVVEFVMYHEMLHARHPVEHGGARRRVHTREFREAERAFDGYRAAKEALRNL